MSLSVVSNIQREYKADQNIVKGERPVEQGRITVSGQKTQNDML